MAPPLLSAQGRVLALVIVCACAGVLTIAWRLDADPRGMGTHVQLGLPMCGWYARFGQPCITCGMTTSFAHASDGSLLNSLRVQPMGAVLSIATATTMWLALLAGATGTRIDRIAGSIAGPWVWWALGLGLVGAWVYKMLGGG
jgi:hypothetical protein